MSERNSENCEFENIDLSADLFDWLSTLCMSNNFSDVIFIVEGQRLSAHKCILAAGSEYFQSLLYGGMSESTQKEIELKAPLDGFKALLRFIYSGRMVLRDMEEATILETLFLANTYGFTKLETAIINYLKKMATPRNVLDIFKIAWLCEFEDLKYVCYNLIDTNASKLLEQGSFRDLSKELLEDVLRRDSFFASEFEIFKTVSEWCKHNRDVDAGSLLSCVRLSLMTIHELSMVRKTGIIKTELLMDAVEMRDVSGKLPYRFWPGENMAALKFGSKVIQGSWETKNHPPGNIFPDDLENLKDGKPFGIKVKYFEEIVIELGIASVINHVEIQFREEQFTYCLEVSSNQSHWERVIDYKACNCRKWQTLYFSPQSVKYIKVAAMNDKGLTMEGLKAMYTEIIPKQINGFIAATVEICGITTNAGEKQKGAILDDSTSSGINRIKLQLDQPYYIGSLRICFLMGNHSGFNYSIDVSTNDKEWSGVASQQDNREVSWQNISFQPRPIVFIKIWSYRSFVRYIDHYIHFDEVQEATTYADD